MNVRTVIVCTVAVFYFENGSSSVIRGEGDEASKHPFQVMLLATTTTGRFLCGGTLLNSEWIITAAHCAEDVLFFEVHLGASSFHNRTEPGRVMQRTSKYILHEKYNPTLARNDVALIKVLKPVKFAPNIQPARLPAPSEKQDFTGSRATASGWGSPRHGETATSLQEAEFEVISNKECLNTFSKLIIQDSVLCARGLNSENVCSGDSGGPLVLEGTRILLAITSFGPVNGCQEGSPGGFSRVTSYLEWIYAKTGIRPS